MHDRSGFARQIDPGLFQQAKLTDTFVKALAAQPCRHIHKNRIAGVFDTLKKRFRSVPRSLMTVDPPILHQPVAPTVKAIRKRYLSRIQRSTGCHDLKGRSRLIGIAETGISPHGIEKLALFLLRLPHGFFRQCKRIIQMKFRNIDHGINLTVFRLHHQNGYPLSALFRQNLLRRLLGIHLDIDIQRCCQIPAVNRFYTALTIPFQIHTLCIGGT